jgi:hypothetical protein
MVSNAVIAEVLKGLNFPASKQQCVDYAKKRDAPKEVIEAIGEEHKKGQMPGPIPR